MNSQFDKQLRHLLHMHNGIRLYIFLTVLISVKSPSVFVHSSYHHWHLVEFGILLKYDEYEPAR